MRFESEILRVAMECATSEDLEQIERNIQETKPLAAAGSDRPKDKVHEFHLLLAQASKNPLYLLMTYSILDVSNEYMSALRYDSVVSLKAIAEHEEIAKCLRSPNCSKALSALCSHIAKDNLRLARAATKIHLSGIEDVPSL